MKKVMIKLGALALALGAGAFAYAPAQAAGTSATSWGCYAQWWKTAAAGRCVPATQRGRVQLWVDQVAQPDYHGPFVRVYKNQTKNPFDTTEARFGARSADVNWRVG